MRDIGKNIKQVRESKQMTQDDLAAMLFVTRQTISNYETGRTRPDIDTLVKLSTILNTDIHDLIYGPPNILSRPKILTRLCLCIGLILVLLLGNVHFAHWANELKQMKYNVVPMFVLNIIYRPAMFWIIGYALMSCICLFYPLPQLKKQTTKWINILIITIVSAYILIVGPLLLSVLIHFQLPALWSKAAYMILGALPSQNGTFSLYGVFFAIGVLLWLCNRNQEFGNIPSNQVC